MPDTDPDETPETPDSPETGMNSNLVEDGSMDATPYAFVISLIVVMGVFSLALKR